MAESIRGNKTLSGTWGELWIDGEKIFEFSKIELKAVSYTHLDVYKRQVFRCSMLFPGNRRSNVLCGKVDNSLMISRIMGKNHLEGLLFIIAVLLDPGSDHRGICRLNVYKRQPQQRYKTTAKPQWKPLAVFFLFMQFSGYALYMK